MVASSVIGTTVSLLWHAATVWRLFSDRRVISRAPKKSMLPALDVVLAGEGLATSRWCAGPSADRWDAGKNAATNGGADARNEAGALPRSAYFTRRRISASRRP